MRILWALRKAVCTESSSFSSKLPSDGWAKRNNWPQTALAPPLPGSRSETQQKAEQRKLRFAFEKFKEDSGYILISGHAIWLWKSIMGILRCLMMIPARSACKILGCYLQDWHFKGCAKKFLVWLATKWISGKPLSFSHENVHNCAEPLHLKLKFFLH